MTALDVFRAIGAAGDDLVARSETHPTRRRGWVLLAAALLALLAAACAIAAHYRLVPWFGVVESQAAVYTNAEQVSFSQTLSLKEPRQGQAALTYAVAVNDQLTIRIDGVFTDGGQASLASGGGGGETAPGVRLLAAEQTYETSSWTEFYHENTRYEQSYTFPVPTDSLSDGMVLSLEMEGAEPLAFTLRPAVSIRDLSGIGARAQSELLDVAAEVRQAEDALEVQLFCINRTDMEFVCYGMGRGYELVQPARGSLRLETENGPVYADRVPKQAAAPQTLRFTGAAAEGAILHIPYVVLEKPVAVQIDQRFSTVAEALAWEQSVSLPYAQLAFSITQDADGTLALTCQVTRSSDRFRLVGFGRPGYGSDQVIPDEGDTVFLTSRSAKLTDDRTLNDELRLVFELPTVTYALITDFSILLG